MKLDLLPLSVPVFLALIAIEVALARARGLSVYRFGDALGDLGCGVAQQVLLVLSTGASFSLYGWVYEHWRLHTWEARVLPWVIALVGVDFIYYWWHRLSHEVNLLWAAHVVHHQSEDYNLAVALRQAVLTPLTSMPFYLPLALLGIPPVAYGAMRGVGGLYQFWIHTELVGKLGWFEGWLNTPSHHRVHHAVNPQYLDKNYGSITVIWDRLFGTFAREEERPVYGVVKPLLSYNPVWAQIQPVWALVAASTAAPRPLDKIRVWLASPAWTPAGVPPYPGIADGSYVRRPKYDPTATRGVTAYVMVQLGIALVATSALLFVRKVAPFPVRASGVLLVLSTFVTSAGLLEGRRWARPLEALRLVLVVVGVAALAVVRGGV